MSETMPVPSVGVDESRETEPLRAQPKAVMRWLASALRVEDWILFGWVALGAPLLASSGSPAGPFDPDQPLQGILRLGAVLAALACLAAKRPASAGASGSSFLSSGAVGPFTGGLLLVAISGGIALDLPSWGPGLFCVTGAAVMAAVRFVAPPLPVSVRRTLVAPFVWAAGGLFWTMIDAVVGRPAGSALRGPLPAASAELVSVAGFLLAFSAVYYAMLMYAPRQVAEREGSAPVWALRYLVFVTGVVVGTGWLRLSWLGYGP